MGRAWWALFDCTRALTLPVLLLPGAGACSVLGQTDGHSDIHPHPHTANAAEAGPGHLFIFHPHFYLARLVPFMAPFSQSLIIAVPSTFTLLSDFTPPAFSQCLLCGAEGWRRISASLASPLALKPAKAGGVRGNSSTHPASQKHHRTGLDGRPNDKVFNLFPQEGSTEQIGEDKGNWGERRVKINVGILQRAQISSETSDV